MIYTFVQFPSMYGCRGWTRTTDLQLMRLTRYQLLHSAKFFSIKLHLFSQHLVFYFFITLDAARAYFFHDDYTIVIVTNYFWVHISLIYQRLQYLTGCNYRGRAVLHNLIYKFQFSLHQKPIPTNSAYAVHNMYYE